MVHVTIPAAKNWSRNPRPSALSGPPMGVSAGGSMTFVTDRSFSGTGSLLVTIPAGGNAYWYASNTAGDWTGEPTGGTWRAFMNISGPVAASQILQATFFVQYTDDTTTSTTISSIANASTRFERFTFPDLAATAGKTIKASWTSLFNNGSGPITVYWGGQDVRHNQPLDGFIHGAAGPNYHWLGTANNSASTRDAFSTETVQGFGGGVYPTITVEVVNRQNQILRDITEHFMDGDITYDLDADTWKGTCRLILDNPTLVLPLGLEFVRISLRLDYPDDTFEEGPIGQFMLDLPSERWSSGEDQWTYQGRDLLGWLADTQPRNNSTAAAGVGFKSGTSYIAAITNLLTVWATLGTHQFSFPSLVGSFGTDYSWEAGTTALTVLTEVLHLAGMQKPWVTPTGVITSAPAGTNPAIIPPAYTFVTGEDSPVRWPFQVDPDTSNIGNRVRVISSVSVTYMSDPGQVVGNPDAAVAAAAYNETVEEQKKKKNKKKKGHNRGGDQPPPDEDPADIPPTFSTKDDPIASIAVNNDPAHPLSFARLGRWIDIPDINMPGPVSGTAVTQAAANQALINASYLPVVARLTTRVMLRGLNEVYELALDDSQGNPIDSGHGRYFCRGWQIQLGLPFEMVHTLKRTINFTETPYFD